jgi:gas vesicle protein
MNRFRVVGMMLLLMVPAIANGDEARTTNKAKASESTQTTDLNSEGNLSNVMKWVQRFGNRVGDEISQAAGKTASAIKNTVKDNKPKSQSQSEENP